MTAAWALRGSADVESLEISDDDIDIPPFLRDN